ncbi:HEXXH motif domain-containing protein [Thermomonospora amylolytica]|uniref:HEXXH motif domain-containing protein n=1 Tax=Thermomonospora amylolytica TaxID=1411117 RepID=UPI000E6C24D6|nr:HEXXH motif domain-containing protein [Thermomonospora amylolytica]
MFTDIPDEIFLDLARGNGGAAAVQHLLKMDQDNRRLMLQLLRVTAVRHGHPEADRVAGAYALLAEIEREHPQIVRSVLAYPTVGAWLRRTLVALNGDEAGRAAARPGEVTALAAAAAVRAGHRCAVEVPVREGGIVLPSLGRALIPGQAEALVRVEHDRAEIVAGGSVVRVPADPHQDGPGWQALRLLRVRRGDTSVAFLLDEHDPDRAAEARSTDDRLGEGELAHWQAMLDEAWPMLAARHRVTAEEVAASIRVLTPLVGSEQHPTSTTPLHALGSIGLSTPPNPHFLAVTLAHEVQHTKLTALLGGMPLTGPDDGARYYAPWREDPRPADGLLQGTYAHLGITAFWRRQREHESGDLRRHADTEFARWREATELGARTLADSGRLTPKGEGFVAELRRTLRPWLREPVDDEALERARKAADAHRMRWLSRHGAPSPL